MLNNWKCSFSPNTSNLSLDSIEEKETQPWHGLVHKLSAFHFDSLNAYFKEPRFENEKNKQKVGLSKEEFLNALEELFGNCKYSLQATILFDQIDKSETCRITWTQFLDFMIENSNLTLANNLQLKVTQISSPPHVKRDTIIKIVLLETQKYFCYAVLSKYGKVGIYDGNMNFLISYHVIVTREDINRKDEERRRRNRWVTDATFLKDVFLFLVTTTARNISIYEASNLNHVILWLILGVPYVIQCLTYYPKDDNRKILFVGDDNGQILSFTFLQAANGLLRRKHNDRLSIFYWIELENEKDFVVIKNYGKIFRESVKRIKFFPDNGTITACSCDSSLSVLIKQYENRRNAYTFKMRRGASCFALSRMLKILLTGSDDGIIRKWNVVGAQNASATLKEHNAGVVDIKIMETREMFLSCSRDAILKLWLLNEEVCLQTVNINFPTFHILGRTIEWGCEAVYPGPTRASSSEEFKWERSHIFVTCCNFLAKISLRLHEIYDDSENLLPPPPLQNSVLIPSTWRINEDLNKQNVNIPTTICDQQVFDKYWDSLKFIVDKKLFREGNSCAKINCEIANMEFHKLKMKGLISQCAPYLVLDLHQVHKIQLPSNLPMANSKKVQNIIDKLQHALNQASIRDQVFLESSSSSRTRSSRSSLLSFD